MNEIQSVIDELNEQRAKAALERYAKVQARNHFSCPRCGMFTMKSVLTTNALSRHADVYICDMCGTDEAVRDFTKQPLPLSQWSFITDILDLLAEE